MAATMLPPPAALPDTLPTEGAAPSNYSYGVRAGDTLHISGMVSFAADGSIVGEGDVAAQIEQAFTNMQAVVEAAGGTMADIVQTTTYLVNTADAPLVSKALVGMAVALPNSGYWLRNNASVLS